MFGGLCGMLGVSSGGEDVLHLIMETLAAAVRAAPDEAARWEPHISPPVLNAWVANVADPLLAEDAKQLLAALAGVPACLQALQVGARAL